MNKIPAMIRNSGTSRACGSKEMRSSTVELNGSWSFALDPKNEGKNTGWQQEPPATCSLIETGFPFEYWYPGYDGVVWYWRELPLDKLDDGHVKRVRIEAVSYWCECWLNGHHLGTHEGAYDEFEFDVSAYLNPEGRNVLAVRVINPPINEEIEGLRSGAPLNQSDLPIGKAAWYFNFGGIWGRVWLESLPTVHLTDLWVDPDRKTGKLKLQWSATNAAEPEECGLSVVIRERNSGRSVSESHRVIVIDEGSTEGVWDLSSEGFSEWSCDNPFLYELEVVLNSTHGSHSLKRQFGVRDFRVEDGQFLLNGRAVRLKGLLQQGAYPRRLAGPASWRMGARELILMKRAGFNFLRVHLKPASDWYLDFADRLGILIMLEPPIGWIANAPRTEERILREVKALIRANRSRTCVVIWGIFNESFHLLGFTSDQVRDLAGRIVNAAREQDNTRLLIDTSGGYAHTIAQGAETMIHDTFHNRASRLVQPRSSEMEGIVDVHVYCQMPPRIEDVNKYRLLNSGTLPLFLSEYGAAEVPPDFAKVLACYSDRDRETEIEDWKLHSDFFRSLTQRFEQAGLADEFGTVRAWIDALNHERAKEIAAITVAARSNPRVAGICFCQLADASGELYGMLDFWRRPKPMFAALRAAISNPAIGIFPKERWIRTGDTFEATLTVALDAEFRCAGNAEVEVISPDGSCHVLFSGTFCCAPQSLFEQRLFFRPVSTGVHQIRGRVVLPNNQTSEVSEYFGALPEAAGPAIKVSARFSNPKWNQIVASCGADVEDFGNNYRQKSSVILLDWKAIANSVNAHCELLGQIRNIVQVGGSAIIFNPDTPMLQKWLLPYYIGVQPVIRTSVYLKHSHVFDGLPNSCVAGTLFASVLGDRWDNADDVAAAGGTIEMGAFSAHMWTRPAEYSWAAGLYRIPLGRGQVFVSHLRLLDQLQTDPLARKILNNLLVHAAGFIKHGGSEYLFRRCIDPIENIA